MRPRQAMMGCIVAAVAAGCTVGPDYVRPQVAVPATYRGAASAPAPAGAPTFGDLDWWGVFPDPDLQALVRTALVQNYDVGIAAARVLAAQSQVTIERSREFPTVEGSASAPYAGYRGSDRPATYPDNSFLPQAGLGAAWEIDFWGRYRRATEAARAELLASEDARHAVMATLVSEVGQAYLALRALDLTLEISRRTVVSRQKSVDLVRSRLQGGVAGILDLRQAETLLYGATKTIPEIERQIEQTENFINVLLGQDPGPVKRGRPLAAQIAAPALPPGLPSDLLTRRPDIRQAEQQLIAANAQVGVATALLYPQVTLSGFAGGGNATIGGASFGPFWLFNALPAISVPVFNMGRLQANVEYNEALAQAAGLRYRQALTQAFREVADALVDIAKRREFRVQQALLVRALDDASAIANLRYEGGVSSYLEVLDTERQLFDAQIALVQASRDESASIIALYRALGGGWQGEAVATAKPS